MWNVDELEDPAEKQSTCGAIIKQLPDWFGMEQANQRYTREVADKVAFVVNDALGAPIGMLSLRRPFPNNADIFWLGVLSTHHRHGIGRALMDAAVARARDWGCKTLTVETLSSSHPDDGYKRTRAFYDGMGFEPLFELYPYGPQHPQVYLLRSLG